MPPASAAAITLRQHYLRKQRYEAWANDQALQSLATVPAERRHEPAFVRATCLLPHVALAREIWLLRLRGLPWDKPADWFPSWDSATTRDRLHAADRAWTAYLEGFTDAEAARVMSYTLSDGTQMTTRIDDIVTHVLNHGTYHRGQLARIVHESGGQRAATDFIHWVRTPDAGA